MKVSFAGHELDLGYCTNIHPGESWDETFANVRNHTEPIHARVRPDAPFGVGLRLSQLAAAELASPGRLGEFCDYLASRQLYVFTINAFPYGQFHGAKIKENVFKPDWTQPERLAYTNLCADLLCRMMPENSEGSISTLPGSLKEWITTPGQGEAMITNMAECALHLRKIHLRTGRLIHLGFEPEPLGLFETTPETISFFTHRLWPMGARHLADQHGFDEDEALGVLKTHLGVCYDTCHMAVEYESPGENLSLLKEAGILISKVQVSSALKLRPGPEALAQLERFADGVYLHQVLGRRSGGEIARWKDIKPALADAAKLMECEELRVHCHVPLYMTSHGEIASTADHIIGFFAAMREGSPLIRHFEVETYTWDVLPVELRGGTLDEDVAREIQWTLAALHPAL